MGEFSCELWKKIVAWLLGERWWFAAERGTTNDACLTVKSSSRKNPIYLLVAEVIDERSGGQSVYLITSVPKTEA